MKKMIIYFDGEWDLMPLIQKIELPNGHPATERDVQDMQSAMYEGKILRDWQGFVDQKDLESWPDATP